MTTEQEQTIELIVLLWWSIMGHMTYALVRWEIRQGRTLAKRVRQVSETGVPPCWLFVTTVLCWPIALWRLHAGYPEDQV